MLLSLNDDCLLHICEFLDSVEQSCLAQTCQRLQFIVEDYWTLKCKNVSLNFRPSAWFDLHDEYFVEFMSCICGNVEHLEFLNIHSETFKLLKNLLFPKTISFTLRFRYNGSYGDEDTKLVANIFPQLKKLSLYNCKTTGNYLWNLDNVVDLKLGLCHHMELKYIKKMYSTLRLCMTYHGFCTPIDLSMINIADCKTLEEISMDDHHSLLLIKELPKLKNLRKLLLRTQDIYDRWILGQLVRRLGRLIHKITFDDVFGSRNDHCRYVREMRNLQSLLSLYDDIEAYQLKRIGLSLADTLREFRFVQGRRTKQIEEALIEFLTECKYLEIFDISSGEFDAKFLRKVIQRLSDDFENRKAPLIFRCFDTSITAEDAVLLSIPGFIEVSLAKEPIHFPGRGCIQCEFNLPEGEEA